MGAMRILLMVRMDVPQDIETRWNTWSYTTYIPNLLNKVSGFLSTRRFIVSEDRPKYLTLYDLKGLDVLRSEASLPPDSLEATTLRLPGFSRGIFEQIYPRESGYQPPHTPTLFIVGNDVPAEKDAEFNAWYDTENIYLPC